MATVVQGFDAESGVSLIRVRCLLTIEKLSALIRGNEMDKEYYYFIRDSEVRQLYACTLVTAGTLSSFQFFLVSDDLSMYNINNALQPEIDKTTSSISSCSPNVCEHHILKGVFRKCQKVPGKRRLQCRSVTSTRRYCVHEMYSMFHLKIIINK